MNAQEAVLAAAGQPLSVSVADAGSNLASADVQVLPFYTGPESGPGIAEAEYGLGLRPGSIVAMARMRAFTGQPGETVVLTVPGRDRDEPHRMVIGVGVGNADRVDDNVLRNAAHRSAAELPSGSRVVTTLAQLGGELRRSVRAVAEGFVLGCHLPPRAGLTVPAARDRCLVEIAVTRPGGPERAAAEHGVRLGQHANWVRRLVESPPGDLVPADLAELFADQLRDVGASCEIWGPDRLQRERFGGTSAVGAGSRHPPHALMLRLAGSGHQPMALTGKGITFDSGGLNVKTNAEEIAYMKSDMAGAAAVVAAILAAVRGGAAPDVIGCLPLAENMPDGAALRPGDVITHPDGRATEVTNTDCEGRLILADAIGYLAAQHPAAVIDVGTLTDGGGVGHALWGVMSTDTELVRRLLTAGELAGDPGWRLPLVDEYVGQLRSNVADLVNWTPSGTAGAAVMAATYLREFAGDVPWAHIDNGGSAYLTVAQQPWPAGATSAPMRALAELLTTTPG